MGRSLPRRNQSTVNDQLVLGNHALLCATWQATVGAHCAQELSNSLTGGNVQGIALLNINFFVTGCR